ncbi:MAG: ArsR/SmtB family transcription factor [Nocardioides sp.]
MEPVSITPSPVALKALAHPVRLRMLGLLRTEGPATATTLAMRLGLNSGATSYHLRQLAQHGFIEDDTERGNGRDRWWRAVHRSTWTDPAGATTPEEHDTYDAFLQAVAIIYTELLQRAVEERRLLTRPWQEAGTFSDWHLQLTPERARELKKRLMAVIDGFEEAPEGTDGSAPFVVNINAFPRPGMVTEP